MTYLNHFDLSLWQECDGLYAKLQEACLKLQDAHGVNVNLLLLAHWLDSQRYWLSTDAWQQLFAQIDCWEQRILQPYRRLRKLSKNNLTENEYQQMLDVELMLERKEQGLILHKLRQCAAEDTSHNLPRYLSLFGIDVNLYPELS
ncbi:TIGR02444 family protein [Shewanella psychrotolerans]|uniref:TIGR02444 family protein n=1 Tax=Shewanella psychrotolerans TaxID=2864206 RepID=UPI001C65F291|nr:TIGR02444 family protein [Shewanella psychrotolerans]QYK01948.1 TIGR02444 family protein [Shewanella psychrotolerans]